MDHEVGLYVAGDLLEAVGDESMRVLDVASTKVERRLVLETRQK